MTKPKPPRKALKTEKFVTFSVGRALQKENMKLQNKIVQFEAEKISHRNERAAYRNKIAALEKQLNVHRESPKLDEVLKSGLGSIINQAAKATQKARGIS